MADPVLWPLDDHTRAKHRVLRAYLDAWIPVMGQQAAQVRASRSPHLLVVDGFAGPGRYATGENGSPLIMLDALSNHEARSKLEAVQFTFLFIEKDGRRIDHLRSEIDRLALPPNAHVRIEQGDFETRFREILNEAPDENYADADIFAFIDPFGYAAASLSLAGRLLDLPRSEALFFLPLTHIARFVGRSGQEQALTSLFDTERWSEAIPLKGTERSAFLLSLFEEQLRRQGQVEHVRSFALKTRDGNDYRLVFATGHPRGVDLMLRAMWSVDPERGTRYIARTPSDQETLFEPSADLTPLLAELRSAFGNDWFTIEQAKEVTRRSGFLADGHLKKLTLLPAEKAGHLQVERPPNRRPNAFTDDVRMRFR